MTDNLKAFIAANAKSPVVKGSVIGRGGKGARYCLEDRSKFVLSAEECAEAPPIRWYGLD